MHLPAELEGVKVYDTPAELRAAVAASVPAGDFAEFGVARGTSARQLAAHVKYPHRLYAFDSFEGLPEDWDQGDQLIRKGTFDTRGIAPDFRDLPVVTVVGDFRLTCPRWEGHLRPLSLLHIDCDIYWSAKIVLAYFANAVTLGGATIFDELHGYPNWQAGEYRAWREWLAENPGFKYEWIGRSKYQAALRVLAP